MIALPVIRSIAAAALVLSASCGGGPDDSLVFTIQQALATSPNAASLDRAVSGEWDRLCVFRPYTRTAAIDSALGRPWKGAAKSGISELDTAVLLVFVEGDRVERHVMFPREKGDFTSAEGIPCMAREDAVFQMRQPIDGSIPWVGPVQRVR